MAHVIIFAVSVISILGQLNNCGVHAETHPLLEEILEESDFDSQLYPSGDKVQNAEMPEEKSAKLNERENRSKRQYVNSYNLPDNGYPPGYYPEQNGYADELMSSIDGIAHKIARDEIKNGANNVKVQSKSTKFHKQVDPYYPPDTDIYTKNSEDVIRYDGNDGAGLTHITTNIKYIQPKRKVTVVNKSTPDGIVTYYRNAPVEPSTNNGYNGQHYGYGERDNGYGEQKNRQIVSPIRVANSASGGVATKSLLASFMALKLLIFYV